MKTKLSIVIPCRNEEGNIENLCSKLISILKQLKSPWEIIFIDDGSIDNTWKKINKESRLNKNIKIIKLRGAWGKAIALKAGFEKASGELIITMDGDLQDDPEEIPNFVKEFEKGYDVVIGWKKVRFDPFEKVISSKIFNWTTRLLTGTKFNDINCGFKAYKNTVLKQIAFGEMFRFIPVFAAKQNFKVKEIVVRHHPRVSGKSKFGWERAIQGFLDLITVVFMTGFSRKPSQFFGLIGLAMGFLGTAIGVYIAYLRFTTGGIAYRYPLMFLGVLLIIVGVQFISTGLIAEMIVGNSKKSIKEYLD